MLEVSITARDYLAGRVRAKAQEVFGTSAISDSYQYQGREAAIPSFQVNLDQTQAAAAAEAVKQPFEPGHVKVEFKEIPQGGSGA